MDIISELYGIMIQGEEFREMASRNRLDLSWIEDRIGREEYKKLENTVVDYSNAVNEVLFRAGFKCAWDLFHQCSK